MAAINVVSVDGLCCVMKSIELSSVETIEQVEAEIRILESLPHHPNIVRYLFHHRSGGRLRLFMTKYHCTLADIVKEKVKEEEVFKFDEIISIITGIVKGMKFLHANSIIHRGTSDIWFLLWRP